MNKNQWADLVNTLRATIDERARRGQAEHAARIAQQQEQWVRNQLRELEQRLATPPPPAPLPDYSAAMRFINSGSVYRPAGENEAPDIWVSDAHGADAPRVPFVKIR